MLGYLTGLKLSFDVNGNNIYYYEGISLEFLAYVVSLIVSYILVIKKMYRWCLTIITLLKINYSGKNVYVLTHSSIVPKYHVSNF